MPSPAPSPSSGTPGLPKPLAALYVFFSSWRFPVLMLAVLASFDLFQLLMLLVPKSEVGLGAFAQEFRIWCYGLNEQTGSMEKGYVILFLAQPAVMCLVLGVVWYQQLKDALRNHRRAMVPYLAFAAVLVTAVCISLVGVGGNARASELAFPAESLRTAKQPPPLVLTNQEGEQIDLAQLRGKVVVVTGIYATCYHTCPLIMAQMRRSLAALSPEQRQDVRVLAVTLNPDHDTREVMAKTAARYQVKAPEVHLLSGPSEQVNRTLDLLEIARDKNPMSGEIDHANLFIVVDRAGKVAYRLTLGERQERWLTEALQLLLKEPRPAGA